MYMTPVMLEGEGISRLLCEKLQFSQNKSIARAFRNILVIREGNYKSCS